MTISMAEPMASQSDPARTFHVTGATGFIGTALCRALEQRGMPHATSRRELVAASQLANIDVLYHCAGLAHREAAESEHRAANYEAVLAQAEAAATSGVERFVFISSVKAEGGSGAYSYWKRQAERELLALYADTPMNVTCLRPALVYGPGVRGNLQLLARAARGGMPCPPAGGQRSLVGINDLCEVLIRLGEPSTRSGIYTVTDGETYDARRIYRALRQGLGRKPGAVWLPRWVWRLACGLLDLSGFTRGSYDSLFGEECYSNSELCEALDWSPSQSLEDLASAIVLP